MTLKRLILLVGIPGSGKSTLAKEIGKQRAFQILNADSIREQLLGNAADQSDTQKVFGILFEQLEKAMSQSIDIVIDNTNLNPRQRKPYLERAVQFGYTDVQLWLLDVPLRHLPGT